MQINIILYSISLIILSDIMIKTLFNQNSIKEKYSYMNIIYNHQKKKVLWSNQEDNALLSVINSFNQQYKEENFSYNWKNISDQMRKTLIENDYITNIVRTGKQCRERWLNHLSNKRNEVEEWNEEENQKLYKLVKEKGKKWKEISFLYIQRTDHQLKNHYYSCFRKKIRKIVKSLVFKGEMIKVFPNEKDIYKILNSNNISILDMNEEVIMRIITEKSRTQNLIYNQDNPSNIINDNSDLTISDDYSYIKNKNSILNHNNNEDVKGICYKKRENSENSPQSKEKIIRKLTNINIFSNHKYDNKRNENEDEKENNENSEYINNKKSLKSLKLINNNFINNIHINNSTHNYYNPESTCSVGIVNRNFTMFNEFTELYNFINSHYHIYNKKKINHNDDIYSNSDFENNTIVLNKHSKSLSFLSENRTNNNENDINVDKINSSWDSCLSMKRIKSQSETTLFD